MGCMTCYLLWRTKLSHVEAKEISRLKIYTALSSWDSEPLYHSKNGIVTLTSGWLFEFQHITCMDTDCSRMLPWFHLLEYISDAFNHLYR